MIFPIRVRIYNVLFILFLSLGLSSCQQNTAITTTKTPLQLGDTTIDLVMHESAAPGLTYLNLHDDENTSVRAALDVINLHGGRVFELKHSGRRNIRFVLEDVSYEFDPNRMFNAKGIAASLERFGPVTDAAIAAVGAFADEVIDHINPSELQLIVTLHNNERGRYSIQSYTDSGIYSGDAQSIHVNPELDSDDFFFVTDRDLYEALSGLGQNVVLQDNAYVTDDGSLSVWSAQNQFPYVNVEAQNGHKRAQSSMIHLVHGLFFP